MTAPSTTPQCIITGCTFYSTLRGFTQHGDLFRLGDTFIFNAVGEPEYIGWPPLPSVRAIIAVAAFFDRRNVFVIPAATATLTQAAKDYING